MGNVFSEGTGVQAGAFLKKNHVYESLPLDEHGRAHYEQTDHETWEFLLERQKALMTSRASKEYLKGVEHLDFKNKIPQHFEVSKILNDFTGWGVEPVPALIQPEEFFSLLSKKKFPAANFIRTPEDIDYIKEPDVFHELFGHCPLLTNTPYSNFMHEFGKLAIKADRVIQMRLFRLFWFTIEFGLIKEDNAIKAYGGGILSSKSEIIYSLESHVPLRVELDPLEALLTPFRIDILQPKYFIIESFDHLFKLIDLDLIKLAKTSLAMKDQVALFPKKKKST